MANIYSIPARFLMNHSMPKHNIAAANSQGRFHSANSERRVIGFSSNALWLCRSLRNAPASAGR